jgi:cellulose biosynthesis protein BcsQ
VELGFKDFKVIVPTLYGGLDLIPSHYELMDLPSAEEATEDRLKISYTLGY